MPAVPTAGQVRRLPMTHGTPKQPASPPVPDSVAGSPVPGARLFPTPASSACRSSWPYRSRPRPTPSPSPESVGWAWMVILRSDAVAAISTASTPSAISSPALTPTMPTPSTRSVPGSMISLVRPSLRSTVVARPGRAPRELRDLDLDAALLRLGLGEPAPREFGIGEHDRRNRRRLERHLVAGDVLDGNLGVVGRLVREHRVAGDVADRVDVRHRRAALRVDGDEAARASPRRRSSRCPGCCRSACGRSTRAPGRRPASSARPRPRR